MEKHASIRDNFVTKMTSATSIFEANDVAFLSSFKSYFCMFAQNLCESQNAIARVVVDYQNCVKQVDTASIIKKFVETKGTGRLTDGM